MITEMAKLLEMKISNHPQGRIGPKWPAGLLSSCNSWWGDSAPRARPLVSYADPDDSAEWSKANGCTASSASLAAEPKKSRELVPQELNNRNGSCYTRASRES